MDLFERFDEKKTTNFESFSVGQNLVIFQKKHKKTQIFATFFFYPTLFLAGNRQTAKKITSTIQNDQNVGQKNVHDILIGIGSINLSKCYPPITGPLAPKSRKNKGCYL